MQALYMHYIHTAVRHTG